MVLDGIGWYWMVLDGIQCLSWPVLAYPGLSWSGLSVGSVWSQMVADSLGWSVSVDIEHLRCSKHFTHFSCFLSLCLIPLSQWKFRLWSKQAFLKTASLFKVSVSLLSVFF